ncbi:hypothetical protein D3C86_1174620 [compost metagenome]
MAQAGHRQLHIGAAEQLQYRRQGCDRAQAAGQYILEHRQPRHHIVVLENHRHMAAQLALVAAAHGVDTGDLQNTGIGLGQAIHAAQQGGLARARLPQHHHEFTGANLQVDAAQYRVVAVALGQLPDVDHFMLRRSRWSTLPVSRTTS